MTRLSLASIDQADCVRRPAYDPAHLSVGLAHIGVGAFHRAHQAVFTEDAIETAGGDWGIVGLALRHAGAAAKLTPQDGLFTLERRSAKPSYRIIGALRRVISAVDDPQGALNLLSDPAIHLVTLTITESAYFLAADGELDTARMEIAHDLVHSSAPISTAGWITAALARRRSLRGGPLSILSCDNLRENSARFGRSVLTLAARQSPELAAWISSEVAFPNTMVDSITPASDAGLLARVAAVTGLDDEAAVQREPYAEWVIQDRFVAGRPAWEAAGAELVDDVAAHESLKLHVLNAAHSALAYLGPGRGCFLVREAIADPEISAFVDAMVVEEIAPALAGQDVGAYWRKTRGRFAQPAMDHRLVQIARDGASKLRERIHPLIIANARAGRQSRRLCAVVRAWLALEGRPVEASLDDPALFGEPFRRDPTIRAAVLEGA